MNSVFGQLDFRLVDEFLHVCVGWMDVACRIDKFLFRIFFATVFFIGGMHLAVGWTSH